MIPYFLRPIRLTDLDDLLALTKTMDVPVASLPENRELLEKRIRLSIKSFKKKPKTPGMEYYFFALEEVSSGRVIGVSGIEARVGSKRGFFVYELQKESFVYPPLKVSETVDVLSVKCIKKGPSELCSLYLEPSHQVHGIGSFLSFARYLFISFFSERFDREIIANLRGYRDEDNSSPFWEAVGSVFFGSNLGIVDTMKSIGDDEFIRELIPRHSIYVRLLPLKAQAVIGEVYSQTKPALHLHEKQGFKTGKWFDIFDGGPYAIANREDIKMIQSIKKGVVRKIIATQANEESDERSFLIANDSLDFRACVGGLVERSDGSVDVGSDLARVLKLREGSSVSYSIY